MDPHLLRRAVKREVNKLAAPCFQLIAEKLIKQLPADGCPSRLCIFHEVILQTACNNEPSAQDVYADLLLVLKYRYIPVVHVCEGCFTDCKAKSLTAINCGLPTHSFSEILTLVILSDLSRYPSNLSDVSSLVYGLYDEEDVETCVRRRRARLVNLLSFVAKLYVRNVVKLGDLYKIFGLFVSAVDEDEEEPAFSPAAAPTDFPAGSSPSPHRPWPGGPPEEKHQWKKQTSVRLDETHLEGLLKAFVIMGHQLEQTVIGREWISSLIQSAPADFQATLLKARANKWVSATPANTNQKLLRALQSQQLTDNDPQLRHRPYMGSNIDYPNYLLKQEAIWRQRNDPDGSGQHAVALETETTVEPVVSFKEPLEEGWLYDPDDPPSASYDCAGVRWRERLQETSAGPTTSHGEGDHHLLSSSSASSSPASSSVPFDRRDTGALSRTTSSKPSQRNSIADNIMRISATTPFFGEQQQT